VAARATALWSSSTLAEDVVCDPDSGQLLTGRLLDYASRPARGHRPANARHRRLHLAGDPGWYPELMKLWTLALAPSSVGVTLKRIRARTYCPGAAIGALMPIAAFGTLYRRHEFVIRQMPTRQLLRRRARSAVQRHAQQRRGRMIVEKSD
jgi:hypothetical protein